MRLHDSVTGGHVLKKFAAEEPSVAIVLSVVCAMHNAAQCVEGFLDSYRRERTVGTQLVVVDGASTDSTWEILLRNRDIIDVAVSEPDAGIYDAWNKALPMCTGRYVSFIGADDRIAAGGLSHLTEVCSRVQNDPHIVAGFNLLTRNAVPVALLGAHYDFSRLCQRMMIAHVMSAHRLSWLASVGGFDASYRSSGDYELLLRERASLRVEVVNVILAYMEDGGTSRTS
ncbi:MAG: glycosyltransferase, partial [Burkholderiaceae bacterium]